MSTQMRMLIGVLTVSMPLSTAEVAMLKHMIQHNRVTLCECSNKVLKMLKHILVADYRNMILLKADHTRPGIVYLQLVHCNMLNAG